MATPTTINCSRRPESLRARRIAAGLTQARLAAMADCSLTFVGNLERGYVPQRSQAVARIERVLDTATPKNDADPVATGSVVTTAAAQDGRHVTG